MTKTNILDQCQQVVGLAIFFPRVILYTFFAHLWWFGVGLSGFSVDGVWKNDACEMGDKTGTFQPTLTDKFLFREVVGRPVCLNQTYHKQSKI